MLAGIALGAALLAKETAALFIPVVFMVVNLKQALRIATNALALFFPVILYNLLALIFTGYADVFFSAIFGMSQPHYTPRSSATIIQSLKSIASYLYDIYSPVITLIFSVTFLISLIQVFSQRRTKLIKFSKPLFGLLLWIVLTIVFFSLTAIRGYYFLFITIPLIVILAELISKLPPKFVLFVTIVIVFFSGSYTINSNLIRSDSSNNEPNNYDGVIVVPHDITKHESQVTIGWTFNNGYKELIASLEAKLTQQDCLILDHNLNSLSVRRYFWANDSVKKHYLGEYPHRFPLCSESLSDLTNQSRIFLVTKQARPNLDLLFTSDDPQSNPRFFIYQLEPAS